MPADWLPGASLSRRYDGAYPGITQDRITKLVLHSTETPVLPGYGGGAAAPTMTINPWPGRQGVWQHFPARMSARALLNPAATSVSENRDDVAQIEIIGYSDAKIAAKHGLSAFDLRNLPDEGYDYIGRVIAWYVTEHDVSVRWPSRWLDYPASYGNSPARMTGPEYDAYTGVLGHQHVSGNAHGDPTLDIARLDAATRRHIGDPDTAALQRLYNEALANRPGYPIPVDGIDGPTTQRAKEAYMTTLDDVAGQLDRIEKALEVPLSNEGRRIFGKLSIPIGRAVASAGMASRRSEVLLNLAHPAETELVRAWERGETPKPGQEA